MLTDNESTQYKMAIQRTSLPLDMSMKKCIQDTQRHTKEHITNRDIRKQQKKRV